MTSTILEETKETKELNLPEWTRVADRKRTERSKAIAAAAKLSIGKSYPSLPLPSVSDVREWPKVSGDLTPRQIQITESIPSCLLQKVSAGVWSAEEVLLAFVARAVLAHYLTNPITDMFVTESLQRARELDSHLQRVGKPIGPLHGLLISLKDVMNIRGHATTIGYIALADSIKEESDELINQLSTAGAVFYCKTNVPQSLMSGECANFLHGRTSTPDNRNLSAGGSSGGEGSLVALGGSPLGIGTDIAGSIRTPANFNGIYGLCPSYGRLPLHSAKYTVPSYLINGVAGPLCRSIDGLEVYTKAVLSLRPWEWDSFCIPMPWSQDLYNSVKSRSISKDLCFGLVAHDGVVLPHPPIQRGMREVRTSLQNFGFDVVDVDLFDGTEKMWETAQEIFSSAGSKPLMDMVSRLPEPLIKDMGLSSPNSASTAPELLGQCERIFNLRQKFLDKWRQTRHLTRSGEPVDVFILPSGGHVAPPHSSMEYFLYEAISNILDWSCTTIPVGRVDPNLDPATAPTREANMMSSWDHRNWESYSLKSYENGAICLQVLGQRLTEEKVLACLRAIDLALGRREDHVA
ncbi:putative fatty-acid amide hydrolase [Dactylonectria macrodidyma]|uniref:amidase n=1 Tax=Dactylonectria macrodidyma TaxID=307937 RepID=A0A9P9DVJ5_9HYPO|nr:putative fatty-acid amide hydrolase [Dactylonectria macrodidyma]